jgi:16S rRNA processing protein RimM
MGRIGAPWGIKGWVKLISFTDPLDNLLEYRRFYIQGDNGLTALDFVDIKEHGQALVGLIKGCDVREAAAQFTGKELLLAKAELPALKEGYYWYQLEGLRVVTLSGQDLGVVQSLLETGANDVLVVRGDAHSVDRQERLLPYVEDAVVKSVDLSKALILVDWDAAWNDD